MKKLKITTTAEAIVTLDGLDVNDVIKEAASLALAQHEIRLQEASGPLLEALFEKHAEEEKD